MEECMAQVGDALLLPSLSHGFLCQSGESDEKTLTLTFLELGDDEPLHPCYK